MKLVGYISLFVCAAALAACNQTIGGPYAAATGTTHLVSADHFRGTMKPCGPDRHVCFEMQRDDSDRRAAGGN